MSISNPTIDEQLKINSAMWFNASPAGKIYLHDQNIALQKQKDAANNTQTTYNAGSGTYTIQPYVPSSSGSSVIVNPTPIKVSGVPIVTNNPKSIPQSVTSQTTSSPTSASPAVVAVTTAINSRKQEAANFTGWDNDTSISAMQLRSWDIYIETGRWDSPEQIQLNKNAEEARKAINITYKGTPYGTPNKAAADALILPDNQPNVTLVSDTVTGGIKSLITGGVDTGGLLKAGLGIGALFVVMSMFRGR